jgi:hypothetical protein
MKIPAKTLAGITLQFITLDIINGQMQPKMAVVWTSVTQHLEYIAPDHRELILGSEEPADCKGYICAGTHSSVGHAAATAAPA